VWALATGKKNARRLKAWLVFEDETGFSQRPPVRATWAPRGQTPILVESFNWKKLSGIGAVRTDAAGRRLRWFLSFRAGSVRAGDLVRFVRALRRHVRKPVILLWDRLAAHRSARVREELRRQRHWLRVEWLPAYAPRLNPLEPLWDWLDDQALANTPVEDLGKLGRRVRRALGRLERKPTVGRGLLRYTGLF
jgi:hypothetical protein